MVQLAVSTMQTRLSTLIELLTLGYSSLCERNKNVINGVCS